MWVRSQNGAILIDAVAFEVVVTTPNQTDPSVPVKEFYSLHGVAIGSSIVFSVGIFSTLERAFQELNTITKAVGDGVTIYGVQPDIIPQQSPQTPR